MLCISPVAIEAQDLIKEFSRDKKVINGVNLSVKKNELFCLVGTNGAGKTTLIKILCGLILPTNGKIFINGCDMSRESEKARVSIGLVTGDERSFYWRLTGRQNLEFFAALYNMPSGKTKTRIKELFNLLDIEEEGKKFQEYSSGIKQRLSIARALLNDPAILFIDEVTKSLDPTSAHKLRVFIKETLVKKQGKTVFLSTHQLHEAEELADRIAFMAKGKIKAVDTLDNFKAMLGSQGANISGIYDHFINRED